MKSIAIPIAICIALHYGQDTSTLICNGSVNALLNSGRAKVLGENRQYLKSICRVTGLCARQDIALRGHHEHDETSHPIKKIFIKFLTLFHLKTVLYCKKVLEMQNMFLKMTYCYASVGGATGGIR